MTTAPTGRPLRPYLLVALLALASVLVFGRVSGHEFLQFDDDLYLTANPQVQAGLNRESIRWAFTSMEVSNWHPLTWLSHMADVEFFGLDPGWHHLLNLLFHVLNAILLFLVLRGMTGEDWKGWFVAALFAVHPLHVESVAWVAERKDLLCALFWFLTMGAYLSYVRRPGAAKYAGVLALFALALLSKPMAVTLPLVLLLLDFWPLGRLRPPFRRTFTRLFLEKVPLLVLSAASSVITYIAQSEGKSTVPVEAVPEGIRLANAAVSYAAYLAKTVWPASLSAYYPHPASIPGGFIPSWQVAGAVLLLTGISLLALLQGSRRPWLATGWLWYAGTLVPVIGLVQVGAQSMADRYTYVTLVGVFLVAAYGIPGMLSGFRHRRWILVVAGIVALSGLSAAAWIQVGHWRNYEVLFRHALETDRNNWAAWNNLGAYHLRQKQYPQAIEAFRGALAIKPNLAQARENLGLAYSNLCIALYREGRREEALEVFRQLQQVSPLKAEMLFRMGQGLK